MSGFSPEIYGALGVRLKVCLDRLVPRLTRESVHHVAHYIEHGEFEMAYESLVLSCIDETVTCGQDLADELHQLGREFDMENESVFAFDFWARAQGYFAKP
jgi:hypothetical protein